MDKSNYTTNLFESRSSSYGTLANNGRARVEQTGDGRIYVVIDGVRYSARYDDLFGINENPVAWLDAFVQEYDKESKKNEFNAPLQDRVDEIEAKMEENSLKAKESRNIQERIKKAIINASNSLRNFLAECGVHFRSSLRGEKKAHADALNNDYWSGRFALTSESNREMGYLFDNNSLAFDKGKNTRDMAFNSAVIDSIFG